ncbi:hypothetical protein APSETT445_005042 [Aspergillus pseudonomiae]
MLHSLTATITILSSVIKGVCNLAIAKILGISGQPHAYAFALLITTVGLIIMAATDHVEMYAAAQVFWTVGNNSLLCNVGIFIADTTAQSNEIRAASRGPDAKAVAWLKVDPQKTLSSLPVGPEYARAVAQRTKDRLDELVRNGGIHKDEVHFI